MRHHQGRRDDHSIAHRAPDQPVFKAVPAANHTHSGSLGKALQRCFAFYQNQPGHKAAGLGHVQLAVHAVAINAESRHALVNQAECLQRYVPGQPGVAAAKLVHKRRLSAGKTGYGLPAVGSQGSAANAISLQQHQAHGANCTASGQTFTSSAKAQATGLRGRLLGGKNPKSPKNRQKSHVPAKKAIFPYETALFSIRMRTAREELLFSGLSSTSGR